MHDTNRTMEFVELPIFSRRTEGHLTDGDIRALQNVLPTLFLPEEQAGRSLTGAASLIEKLDSR